MPTLKEDLSFGTASEHNLLGSLQSFLDTTLERKGGYEVFDYTNPTRTIWVELKTRRVKHDLYKTTLIGANKIAFCSNPDVQYYFVFCFSDGVYYIKYEKDLCATFETKDDYYRTRRSDCWNKRQTVVYIPIEHLSRFEGPPPSPPSSPA